eukprot:3056208-Pyramimonas_sp.AAC.1
MKQSYLPSISALYIYLGKPPEHHAGGQGISALYMLVVLRAIPARTTPEARSPRSPFSSRARHPGVAFVSTLRYSISPSVIGARCGMLVSWRRGATHRACCRCRTQRRGCGRGPSSAESAPAPRAARPPPPAHRPTGHSGVSAGVDSHPSTVDSHLSTAVSHLQPSMVVSHVTVDMDGHMACVACRSARRGLLNGMRVFVRERAGGEAERKLCGRLRHRHRHAAGGSGPHKPFDRMRKPCEPFDRFERFGEGNELTPLNGGFAPLNGGFAPLNGGFAPLNGGFAPLNGGVTHLD